MATSVTNGNHNHVCSQAAFSIVLPIMASGGSQSKSMDSFGQTWRCLFVRRRVHMVNDLAGLRGNGSSRQIVVGRILGNGE